MLSVHDALSTILETVRTAPALAVDLQHALGRTLREAITADADSPPFDKALMDGFAVCAADLSTGQADLRLLETITAGQVPAADVVPGTATQIMTGAPLPPGADAVVRVEDSRIAPDRSRVTLDTAPVAPGCNVLRRGTAMRAGDVVLEPGRPLRPQQIALLAELGRARIAVSPRPRVAVLATGDELVEVGETPGPGQIRNSNALMLAAQVESLAAAPELLGIARDREADLTEKIAAGLEADFLLLSGGVSAGTLDLVPGVLERLGVRCVFHKVRVKPGKPLWFGVKENGDQKRTYVFGLPGNPVSGMVCFELFVAAALRQFEGRSEVRPLPRLAKLSQAHVARGDRPTYHPARILGEGAETVVQPVAWRGSADLRSTAQSDGLMHVPAGDREYPAGTLMEVWPWSR